MRIRQWGRDAAALIICAFTFASAASEITHAEIKFVRGAYEYHFEAIINAPLDASLRVVTDYDNLKRINNDVVESRILERYDEHHLKRRLWIEHCLLVFCFDLFFVEQVEQLNNHTIKTTIIPEESNFDHGSATWTLTELAGEQTLISVKAEQKPSFWIPPVIGPLVMRRAFRQEVKETAANIEKLARLP